METKKCKTCEIDKEIIEFQIRDRKLNTYRTQCKLCYNLERKEKRENNIKHFSEINKKSYEKNKETRIDKVITYRKNNKDKVKIWSKTNRVKTQNNWLGWKSTLKCSVCGENNPYCLEFHHINPIEKEGLISKMKFSKKKLEEELKKCIILCGNCHRKHHYNENNL